MNGTGQAAFEAAQAAFAHLSAGLKGIDWQNLPAWLQEYIKDHPNLAAAEIIILIVYCFPGLLTAGLFSVLGFTSTGPAAGSAATWFMSHFGVNAAYSVLQSAAMSGYGLPIVQGVVSGAAAATAAGAAVWEMVKSKL